MEEILASIRRIISEDDAPEAAPAAAAPPPPPEERAAGRSAAEDLPIPEDEEYASASGGAAYADDSDDELELTDKVESHGDLDVYSPPAAADPENGATAEALGALVSAPAAAAAAAAFGRLSGNIAMPAPGRTLEDVVRELLKPLLQQWLDDNLPAIVQRAVDAEVTRIARGG